MSVHQRQISLEAYQTILYRRALHPELFTLKGRRTLRHGQYEVEIWLMTGAHLLRMHHNGSCATELVTHQESGLPTEGAVSTFPCAGDRDFEHTFEPDRLRYMTSVQTETLAENLYAATYAELLEFGQESEALIHKWADAEGGKCLSMIDVQRYSREVHAQSYHMVAHSGFVLRTQTIFEHA